MPKEPSWEEAIQLVLRQADGMMRYTEISEKITADSLKKSPNAAAIVAATLATSLRKDDSPFLRVGRGEYILKDNVEAQSKDLVNASASPEDDNTAGALQAFGMFWQRDQVIWSGKPKIMGRQGLGATTVNFSEQVGVYLLHDRERVIYVGRASDTLFARLKFHTTDRLGGRWDRFSWFGLRDVRSDGTLSEPSVAWTHTVVIETLEALLIESLEPPLNRKRGDNFSGAEYVQVVDPDIERGIRRKMLSEMVERINASDG
jgi:hypothetical protein